MKDQIIRINSPRLVHQEKAADFEKEIVEDERAWTAQFDTTTDEQWARMAEMARRDIAAGDSMPLEEFLRTRKSGE